MRIALISKLWEATSVTSTGGTGACVGNLADELVKRGHRVTVFGTKNSKTRGRVISIKNKPYQNDYSENVEYLNISNAFRQAKSFDLIHCHVEQKACHFASTSPIPVLISLRYGEFFDDELDVLKTYKHLHYATISKAMVSLFPFLRFEGFVHNGIDPKRFPFQAKPKGGLLFLGRLSPQKGPDIAIRIARKLQLPLTLAGKIVDNDLPFLQKHVFPFVDGKRIRYVGSVGFERKVRLLQQADALLHPIRFFEAFGMTLIEAMACGTPVLSFDHGSPKEIIQQGVTGFVVSSEAEMIARLRQNSNLDRSACRRRMEQYFTASGMAKQTERLYRRLCTSHRSS